MRYWLSMKAPVYIGHSEGVHFRREHAFGTELGRQDS